MMKTLLILLLILITLSSCTTEPPRMTKVNGVTHVQTEKKFLGIPIHTKTEVVKTKEQQLDDIEVAKERRETEQDLIAEERQSAAVYWIGLGLMIAAPVCVIIGYIMSGWKFWGTMGALSGLLGAAFWSFEHLIPYLKWGAAGLVGLVVLWTMHKAKDFSLIDKLRQSEPGELFKSRCTNAAPEPEKEGNNE